MRSTWEELGAALFMSEFLQIFQGTIWITTIQWRITLRQKAFFSGVLEKRSLII